VAIARAERAADPVGAVAEAVSSIAPGGTLLAVVRMKDRPKGEGEAIARLFTESGFAGFDLRRIDAAAGEGMAVLRGRRAEDTPLRVLHAVPEMFGGCNVVRMGEPAEFLNSLPGVEAATVDINRPFPMPPGQDRLLVIQRSGLDQQRSLESVRSILKAGYILVMEMDDHPDYCSGYRENGFFNFRAAHAVQVSTGPLAEWTRIHNPNVAVFENQIARLPEVPLRRVGHDVSMIFGAANRAGDWAPYMDALNRVLQARPRFRVHVVHDRDFHEALRTDRKTFAGTLPLPQYHAAISRADVCFMPLADTEFARCKSDLKFLDAAMTGAVALASPTVYAATIRDGETGVLFDSPEALESRLIALIDDDARRQAISRAAYAHVRDARMLAYHVEARARWYRMLLSERARLDRELREREPRLAGG